MVRRILVHGSCNGAAFEACHNCNKFFSTVASMLVLLGLSRRNFTKCGLDGCIDRRARSLVTFVPANSAAASAGPLVNSQARPANILI